MTIFDSEAWLSYSISGPHGQAITEAITWPLHITVSTPQVP